MAHNEWDPDEFLDEFLDFDYRHPVPGSSNGSKDKDTKGVPADRTKQPKQEHKKYGLGDDYHLYEELRHSNGQNAGDHAADQSHGLRSSGAKQAGIPAPEPPLSAANRFGKYAASKSAAAAKSAAASIKGAAGGITSAASGKEPAPQADARPKQKSKSKNRLFKASELASGAFGAARKLVASEEDLPPEEIPAAAASAADIPDINAPVSAAPVVKSAPANVTPIAPPMKQRKKYASDEEEIEAILDMAGATEVKDVPAAAAANAAVARAAEARDQLSELFAELGESDKGVISSDENEALAQAQQDAYDRYRSNYVKNFKKRAGFTKVGFIPRWLSRIYVIALAAFVAAMTIMNVLPFGMLIAFYVVLGLLSLIIIIQLRKGNIKKWVRAVACITAVLLIGIYGVGTAYSMGTLSFLDYTAVKNEKRVASVTRNPFNVCITGIDTYGTIDKEGRSDVNMIMTVNPDTEQILLTSIPRDYQIYMPDKDYAMDKLTHTGFYGEQTTIAAEEDLLDTTINYYVKVNFTTVKGFIYSIGGIDVYSEYEFTPVKRSDWTVKKGWNHMDGKQALAFARERKAFPDGDNQRIKNQQAVFEAIIKKATSSKTMLLNYNKILNNLKDYFLMSFSSSEMRSLLKMQLAKNPDWKIYRNTITGSDGSMQTYSTGSAFAYVMVQDQDSIDNAKKLINAVLDGKTLDKDDDGNVVIVGEGSGEDEEGSGEN